MNRKGQYLTSRRFLSAFKTLFIITVGILLVLYTLNTTRVDERKTRDLKALLYAEQLLNNPACFAHEQPTGRTDHGILEAVNLDQSHLDGCSRRSTEPPVRIIPAKVTVLDPRYRPSELETSTWTGAGKETKTFKRDVKLYDGEKHHPATIIIHVNPW